MCRAELARCIGLMVIVIVDLVVPLGGPSRPARPAAATAGAERSARRGGLHTLGVVVGLGLRQREHPRSVLHDLANGSWGRAAISLKLLLRPHQDGLAQARWIDGGGAGAPASQELLVAMRPTAPQAQLPQDRFRAREEPRRLQGRRPGAARAPRAQPVAALVPDNLRHSAVLP